VLRNRKTNDVLFVVNFALIPIDKKAQEEVETDDDSDTEDDEQQNDDLD
jgi:hypothetical protein